MKKLSYILMIAVALIVGACEGPAGPMGPPGEDGGLHFGSVYEFQGDFNAGNGYSILSSYPSNMEVYDGDVVLVYILWETDNGLDVWRLMPQTVLIREDDVYGEIIYNYDYTYQNFRVFLEFTINEEDLLESETQNQVFRVAVVPAEIAKTNDVSSFSSLTDTPGLQLKTFDSINNTPTSIQK